MADSESLLSAGMQTFVRKKGEEKITQRSRIFIPVQTGPIKKNAFNSFSVSFGNDICKFGFARSNDMRHFPSVLILFRGLDKGTKLKPNLPTDEAC